MDESEVKPFDDPALKAAVKRAWALERAPLDLAGRARTAMRQAVPMDDPAAASWRLPRWTAYAAAALILLVVGLSVFVLNDAATPIRPGDGFAAANVLPAAYLTGLVQRHDACRDNYTGRHHNLKCDKGDFQQIAAQLEAEMHGPVLVIDPRQDGWNFHGAAMCPVPVKRGAAVESRRASHLLFDREGRQSLSVISVPFEGSCRAKPGETFVDDAGQNHLVVGFLDNNELHCLIGHSTDGSLTRDDLRRMGEKYQIAVQTIRLPHNMLIAPTAYVR